MSTKYLFAAMKARTDNPVQKLILIYLADCSNEDGYCWPAHSTIADNCETTRVTVKKHIDSLLVKGYIEIEHRSFKGFKTSNMYKLLEPELIKKEGRPLMHSSDTTLHSSDTTDVSQLYIEPISNLVTTTTKGKPSVDEVRAYVETRDIKINPDKFCDYYSANGWKVGRNPMKDWKAAVRTWEAREKSSPAGATRSLTSTKDTTLMEDLTDTSWAT
jgi:biotin operon repressor